MSLKLFLLFSAVLLGIHYASAATDKVVCFYASWAVYRNGAGAFKPTDINAKLCTHVFYAFLGVEADGTLKILDPWNEVDLHGLENVNSLKSINPDLKALISIGGWNAGHELLGGIIGSSTLRAAFVKSCIEFFKKWKYDGIDIDWEYPLDADKANFNKLLDELQTAFKDDGYILSVTVSGAPQSFYDAAGINKAADMVNLMSYDYHVPGDGVTGYNAPLYGSPSINESVHAWIAEGIEPSKLTLSVPFYGHTYNVVNPDKHDTGEPATTGIGGPLTQSPGTLGYNEVCAFYSDWTFDWDDDSQVPFMYDDGTDWVSFDDVKSIGLKAKFAKDTGLGGVAVWSVDTDDFTAACGTKDPLLQAIKDNID